MSLQHQQPLQHPQQQQQVIFTTPTPSVNYQQTMMLPPGNVLPPARTAIQTPVYIVVQQPPSAPLNMSVKSTRGLAMAQLAMGVCMVVLAVVHLFMRSYRSVSFLGTGVWVGLWVITTGIIGIVSSQKSKNKCLNGVNLGFSIVSCCLAFIGVVIYANGVALEFGTYWRWYDNSYSRGGQGILPILLLALSVAEFCVALAACIFTCKTFSCCKPRAGYIQTSANVPTVAMGNYPQQSVAMGGYPQQQYTAQVSQPPPYTQTNQAEGANQAQVVDCEQKVPLA